MDGVRGEDHSAFDGPVLGSWADEDDRFVDAFDARAHGELFVKRNFDDFFIDVHLRRQIRRAPLFDWLDQLDAWVARFDGVAPPEFGEVAKIEVPPFVLFFSLPQG